MNAYRTQRKIALILSLFGLSAAVVNFLVFAIFRGYSLIEILTNYFFYTEVIFTLIIFLTRKIDRPIIRFTHVVILLLVSTLAILDEYDSFYGLGFYILAVLLSYRYGFLEKRFWWKTVISGIVLLALIEYSTIRNQTDETAIALDALVFVVLFGAVVYLVFQDEIDRLAAANRDIRSKLADLRFRRAELERDLVGKSEEIARLEARLREDEEQESTRRERLKKEFSLTGMEHRIVLMAFDSGESNRYLAEELGIKESTVKQHLNRAYSKLRVRSRSDMHKMIREFIAGGTAEGDEGEPYT